MSYEKEYGIMCISEEEKYVLPPYQPNLTIQVKGWLKEWENKRASIRIK